jgi:hypothetical protein
MTLQEHTLGAFNKYTNIYVHPSVANKQDEYICMDCGKDVFIRQGNTRIHHFAHYKEEPIEKCNFYNEPNEMQIHKTAQLILKYILETKIPLTIGCKCNKCNKIYDYYEIAQITDNLTIIQLEHRFIYKDSVKIADVAYLENNQICCIFEIYNTHKTHTENRPVDTSWFELDATTVINTFNDYIYNNTNQFIQNIYLHCIRSDNICGECAVIMHDTIIENIENTDTTTKGKIYFNQRGAGCGKTYESIQLIQKDIRFIEKETFIYLSRMHSAKEVIYKELKEQEQKGQLHILEILENEHRFHDNNNETTIDTECYDIDEEDEEENENAPNQYKITYLNKNTNKEITIIIGTVDSYNYAIVDKCKIQNQNNYFKGIVSTIYNGDILPSLLHKKATHYIMQKHNYSVMKNV